VPPLDLRDLRPMKAVAGDLPTETGPWVFEIKWDGVRILAAVEPDGVRLASSRGNDVTRSYPELQALRHAVGGRQVLLDGEVVALDDAGRPSFGRLQGRMHVGDAAEAARRAEEIPIAFEVFDLLVLDGTEAMAIPFEQRRALLEEVVEPGSHWHLSPLHDDGAALFEAADRLGLEGIVAKRRDSVYLPGKRSPSWRKVKVRRRQEFVVGGWLPGAGNRSGQLGSVLVGYHEPAVAGSPLRYAGRVGSGFDVAGLRLMGGLLAELAIPECPFDPAPPRADARLATWVSPELVVEVAFAEWTGDGRLRHPAYLGLRTDKPAGEVTADP
jgi:bifunctional non-homologous end joining protein LigD